MKEDDLNFPLDDYSTEELPASIAELAEYIKQDQVLSLAQLPDGCHVL